MKKAGILLMVALTFMLAACNQGAKNNNASHADSFSITGTIAGLDSGWVMLLHSDTTGNQVTDSAAVVKNTFTFQGVQNEPTMYYLSVKGIHDPNSTLNFFVENAKINITARKDSIAAADITGSPTETMYQTYKKQLQPVTTQMNRLNKEYADAYKKGDKGMMKQLDETYDSLSDVRKEVISQFVKSNSGSVVSAWAIARNFLFSPDAKVLEGMYGALDTTIQHSSYGKRIKKSLDIAEKLAIGKPAPNFTQNDTHGDPLSLSSLKGKYVLVDFWASWCGPCRAENPNVVKAYQKYKNSGFTVLGVSLDEDKADWLKAIKNDHLTWNQVSDLKGWKNAVAQQYGIRAIPANFLLDKNGIIVAHDLRGDKLEKKLAEIFK